MVETLGLGSRWWEFESLQAHQQHESKTMQMRASHILVETQQQASELLNQITAGADFAALAQQHSMCPSGSNGGDVGFFSAGQIFVPIELAVFAIEVGEITQPVKTDTGWHLIKRTA